MSEASAFTIESDEGLPLRGNFDAPGHPRALVVLIHGFKGFKDWGFFPWLAECLRDAGYAVCRFNMSRCGVAERTDVFDRLDLFAEDTYSIQLADLRAVVRHAQSHFPLPTFLFGHSRGGGIALLGAEEVPDLRGVVTWSAISSADRWDAPTVARWRADGFMDIVNQRTHQTMRMSTAILDDYDANRDRLDVLGTVARLRVPLFVVHGGADDSVPVAEGHAIASRASEAVLLIEHNASHTYNAIHPLINVPAELDLAAELSALWMRLKM